MTEASHAENAFTVSLDGVRGSTAVSALMSSARPPEALMLTLLDEVYFCHSLEAFIDASTLPEENSAL